MSSKFELDNFNVYPLPINCSSARIVRTFYDSVEVVKIVCLKYGIYLIDEDNVITRFLYDSFSCSEVLKAGHRLHVFSNDGRHYLYELESDKLITLMNIRNIGFVLPGHSKARFSCKDENVIHYISNKNSICSLDINDVEAAPKLIFSSSLGSIKEFRVIQHKHARKSSLVAAVESRFNNELVFEYAKMIDSISKSFQIINRFRTDCFVVNGLWKFSNNKRLPLIVLCNKNIWLVNSLKEPIKYEMKLAQSLEICGPINIHYTGGNYSIQFFTKIGDFYNVTIPNALSSNSFIETIETSHVLNSKYNNEQVAYCEKIVGNEFLCLTEQRMLMLIDLKSSSSCFIADLSKLHKRYYSSQIFTNSSHMSEFISCGLHNATDGFIEKSFMRSTIIASIQEKISISTDCRYAINFWILKSAFLLQSLDQFIELSKIGKCNTLGQNYKEVEILKKINNVSLSNTESEKWFEMKCFDVLFETLYGKLNNNLISVYAVKENELVKLKSIQMDNNKSASIDHIVGAVIDSVAYILMVYDDKLELIKDGKKAAVINLPKNCHISCIDITKTQNHLSAIILSEMNGLLTIYSEDFSQVLFKMYSVHQKRFQVVNLRPFKSSLIIYNDEELFEVNLHNYKLSRFQLPSKPKLIKFKQDTLYVLNYKNKIVKFSLIYDDSKYGRETTSVILRNYIPSKLFLLNSAKDLVIVNKSSHCNKFELSLFDSCTMKYVSKIKLGQQPNKPIIKHILLPEYENYNNFITQRTNIFFCYRIFENLPTVSIFTTKNSSFAILDNITLPGKITSLYFDRTQSKLICSGLKRIIISVNDVKLRKFQSFSTKQKYMEIEKTTISSLRLPFFTILQGQPAPIEVDIFGCSVHQNPNGVSTRHRFISIPMKGLIKEVVEFTKEKDVDMRNKFDFGTKVHRQMLSQSESSFLELRYKNTIKTCQAILTSRNELFICYRDIHNTIKFKEIKLRDRIISIQKLSEIFDIGHFSVSLDGFPVTQEQPLFLVCCESTGVYIINTLNNE